jgi:hypothetical protein
MIIFIMIKRNQKCMARGFHSFLKTINWALMTFDVMGRINRISLVVFACRGAQVQQSTVNL